MRVGFTLIGGGRGTGGYNYLLNLLSVLLRYQPDRIVPVLFLGSDVAADEAAPFAAVGGLEIVRDPAFDRRRKALALASALVLGSDAPTRAVFVHHAIDVLFESARFHGWRLPFPVIAWIPDFQHRELPHMFTRSGWWKRELGLRAQMAAGRVVMLSSEDARRSCERHYPQTVGRTRTVHFAVPPGSAPSLTDARRVADGYGLPQRFVFMPNQFSKHKNHLLVVAALRRLTQRGHAVCIAASGRQLDERHPDHFPAVERAVAEAGVGDALRLLGLVPYAHLAPLMRASMAVLNPSLFEGWSTPVEEARALGVPLVLSDLDVHREQAGAAATYFDRHSADSLADALAALEPPVPCDADARCERAHDDTEARVERFAAHFAALAADCAARRFPVEARA
ncbi:MAG: glycosyltransferase [Caldimonas sp.]